MKKEKEYREQISREATERVYTDGVYTCVVLSLTRGKFTYEIPGFSKCRPTDFSDDIMGYQIARGRALKTLAVCAMYDTDRDLWEELYRTRQEPGK
jgi:hypothetical protein